MAKAAKTVDQFLAGVSPDQRAALQKLRRAIKAAMPRAEETISYQIPAFRLDGRVMVWFGAGANHCAFYPGAYPIRAHKDKLTKYKTSKGTIRFPPDKPLPASLVRTLVKARIAEQTRRPARRA
ncbi:MAG TPA: DUF1801 domain-containing protein [Vicinamibacterales bacterium]|jgi:uncharacterized protein YdhG (YjbR/CyaY superfamily)|nr:DUF1801 domain-containing protein [Vicinamibacterales bacterium]